MPKTFYDEVRSDHSLDLTPAAPSPENYDAGYSGLSPDIDDCPQLDDRPAELQEADIDPQEKLYVATPLPRNRNVPEVKLPKKALTSAADILLKENPQPLAKPANDNQERKKESWHLRDAITRGDIGVDEIERGWFLQTARHVRSLLWDSGKDPLGLAVHTAGKEPGCDYHLPRDERGNVLYLDGMSLDRKKSEIHTREGDDVRHIGSVRTSARSLGVSNSGFDVFRDDPFVFRQIDARQSLDEVIAATGPLWASLERALLYPDTTLASIGRSLGVNNQKQASGVGTAVMALALRAAGQAIQRGGQAGETYVEWLRSQPDCTPVPARRLVRAFDALREAEYAKAA